MKISNMLQLIGLGFFAGASVSFMFGLVLLPWLWLVTRAFQILVMIVGILIFMTGLMTQLIESVKKEEKE